MANKEKTKFFCRECGYESAKWLGQCPSCRQWDTFVEAPAAPKNVSGSRARTVSGAAAPGSRSSSVFGRPAPSRLREIEGREEKRTGTGIGELDRVLGGGIVAGSLVLVGGDPGIGKSTLLLMMSRRLAESGASVLYVSGEESLRQIKMRADRLEKVGDEMMLLAETDLDRILEAVEETKPQILIIDSIQTMTLDDVDSAPGSIAQVRESTSVLMKLAKTSGISIFIVGHVTKEGTVAGPKMLEHMVDTVLYFEGDDRAAYRVLRSVKNRFGSTNEIGVFEMRSEGLAEIPNPSEYMLQGKPEGEAGSVVACSMEGTRPILVEVQALVCQTNFNMPRRTAAGTDYNRVNLLMAVLEKRIGVPMAACDAYVNVAGGMRINEPALDLPIVMAILSSFRNKAVDSSSLLFGEVGLTGEVRGVNLAEQRVTEAEKMGFTTCVLPASNLRQLAKIRKFKIRLIGITHVRELIQYLQ